VHCRVGSPQGEFAPSNCLSFHFHFHFTQTYSLPSRVWDPHSSLSSTIFSPQLDWLKFELGLGHFTEAGFTGARVIFLSIFLTSFNDASSLLCIGDVLYEIRHYECIGSASVNIIAHHPFNLQHCWRLLRIIVKTPPTFSNHCHEIPFTSSRCGCHMSL
jgi:hypothetical protein